MNTRIVNERGEGKRVFYAGDGDFDGAASYLLCIMAEGGCRVEYLPSRERLEALPSPLPDLMILSDYPRAMAEDRVWEELAAAVDEGLHLLMIGGWESFHGLEGGYYGSPLERVLPTAIAKSDDRMNSWQGVAVLPAGKPGPFSGLDWSAPPAVAGYNRLEPKPGSAVLLEGHTISITYRDGLGLGWGATVPLACSQGFGLGRGTALAFDLAPHWVAGMVDWGLPRRRLSLEEGVGVETGAAFVQFVQALIAYA